MRRETSPRLACAVGRRGCSSPPRDGHRAGRSGSAGIASTGTRSMPQIGHWPGWSRTICGCMGTGVLRLEVRDRVLERGLVPGVLGVPFPRRRRPVVTAEPDATAKAAGEREDSPDGLGRAHRTLSVSRMVRPAPPPSMVRGLGSTIGQTGLAVWDWLREGRCGRGCLQTATRIAPRTALPPDRRHSLA